jgi:hypothetical protein
MDAVRFFAEKHQSRRIGMAVPEARASLPIAKLKHAAASTMIDGRRICDAFAPPIGGSAGEARIVPETVPSLVGPSP